MRPDHAARASGIEEAREAARQLRQDTRLRHRGARPSRSRLTSRATRLMYVLDTNTCIYFLRGDFPHLMTRVRKRSPSELGVSAITVAELYYGVFHSSKVQRNLKVLSAFLADLTHLDFGSKAARIFGKVKQDLASRGKVVGAYDLLIAATVLCEGYTLVTHDFDEFSMVEGLLIEDWTCL